MKNLKSAANLLAMSFVLLGSAQAAADLRVAFRDPTGTVTANQNIDIWVTMSNVGDQAFSFNQALPVLSAVTGLPIPTLGVNTTLPPSDPLFGRLQPFGNYTSLGKFISRSCANDSFIGAGCGVGAYDYQAGSLSGQDWFSIANPFSLAVGASRDILLYTLKPVGGVAPAGTYLALSMGPGLRVTGTSALNGGPLEATVFLANTCSHGELSCGFTRTVVAVPEPGALAMMGAGVALLLGWRRRLPRQAA